MSGGGNGVGGLRGRCFGVGCERDGFGNEDRWMQSLDIGFCLDRGRLCVGRMDFVALCFFPG